MIFNRSDREILVYKLVMFVLMNINKSEVFYFKNPVPFI